MEILISLIVASMFIGGFAIIIIILLKPGRTHNPNHPGIVVNGRDIICPKCHSPYCQYDYQTVQHNDTRTTYRIRPLHPFKPVKSTTYEIPTFKSTVKQYRCMNCGWIFK